jgi:hypothetical protein
MNLANIGSTRNRREALMKIVAENRSMSSAPPEPVPLRGAPFFVA